MAKIEILKCYCGSVELELTLPNGFENLWKCNYSIYSKRNAVVASVSINYLKVVKGDNWVKVIHFQYSAAKHYFCSIWGIYTHHQKRLVSSKCGFNIACVEGVKIEDYKDVRYLDGRDNHPKDSN